MKRWLSEIRKQTIVDFWESNKAEFKIKEIGQIFGVTEGAISKILSQNEKSKDPMRFIKKHVKWSHNKLLKQMENEKNSRVCKNRSSR